MAKSKLPPGVRFHPTDEELLVYYLKPKVAGRRVPDGVIGEIELYKFEPADLHGLAILQSSDQEWFFFTTQDKKYHHGGRTNRTTEAGYWKATGKDRKISAGSCTGMKKTLIYYCGRAPHGKRTDWVMHEFRLDEEFEKKLNSSKSFVLCRVRRKGGLGPRNGEQYGAPVLETREEDEGGPSTNYPCEEAWVLPSADSKFLEGHGLDMPLLIIDEGIARTEEEGAGDDIESFLQTLISNEQQPAQDEVLSVDDLLELVDNLNDFAVMEPAHGRSTNTADIGFEDMDNVWDLLQVADNESAILEDVLLLATGQGGSADGFDGRRALEEPSYQQALDDVDNDGFIELADLEDPCDDQGTLEYADIEALLYDLDNGVENTRLAHDRPQVQSLQSSCDSQSLRHLQDNEASGTVHEQQPLEVPLDSSQGLSVIESIHTRLLTSDEGGGFSDDLPSGFVLNTDQERVLAGNSTCMLHRHSYLNSGEELSEALLVTVCNLPGRVNVDMKEGVGHSAACLSEEDVKVVHGEHSFTNSDTTGQPNSTGLPSNVNQLNSSVHSPKPSPSAPSSLARVVSGILGRVNVLPASAGELPVELGRYKPLVKDSSKYLSDKSEFSQSAVTHNSISSASLHCRVKLIDVEHTAARPPEEEIQLLVSHTVSEHSSTKPCKLFFNGLSLFLFRITTLAVILFYMLRGFCRSMRCAFV